MSASKRTFDHPVFVDVEPAGRIALLECGREEPDAPVALLIHGLGHWSESAWEEIAPRLASTHRVLAFDLPGFGQSDKPDVRYDLPFFVATLHGLVQTLGLQRYTLIGHSLGGMIAADYAGAYPEEIASLVLIAPAGFLRTPKIFVRIVAGEPVSRLFSLRPSRRFVRNLLEQSFHDPSMVTEELCERAFTLSQDPRVCRAFLRVYAGALRDFLDLPGFHARLARYAGPTLLVWGRQDLFIPIRALESARKVYPHADVLILENAGHCPNLEVPGPIVQRILSGPSPRVIYSREYMAFHHRPAPEPHPRIQPAAELIGEEIKARFTSAIHALASQRVAVEVLSPGQKLGSLAEKIHASLAGGCELVIVVDPQAEYAVLYDGARVQRIERHDHLRHPALPGFDAKLAWFFESSDAGPGAPLQI